MATHGAEKRKMISIWTWVGIVLCTFGTLVLGTGMYYVGTPPTTVLGHLHPRIWWGGFMVCIGLLFLGVLGRTSRSR